MSMTSTVGRNVVVLAREGERRLEAVVEELAVGQAREVVVHRVVQQALLGGLRVGDVGERADDADDLAVRADDRPRLEAEPVMRAGGGAQAEVLRQAAAALLDHGVEGGAVAVAVEGMDEVEPGGGRPFERRRA